MLSPDLILTIYPNLKKEDIKAINLEMKRLLSSKQGRLLVLKLNNPAFSWKEQIKSIIEYQNIKDYQSETYV